MTEVKMTQNDDMVIVYDPRATVMIDDESVSVKTDLPVDVIAEPPPIDPPEPPPIDPPPTEPDKPPAVTNLRVTVNSSGFQRLEWDEPDMVVDGYLVFRKIDGQDDDFQPAGLPSYDGGPRYNSFGLPQDTLITYRVVYGNLDFNPVSNYAEVSETTEKETVAPPPVDGETDLDEILFYENFESAVPGVSVEAQTGIGGTDMGSIDVGEHYTGVGTRCMKTRAPARDSGFGKWGFILENKPWLPKGGSGTEIWVRWAHKVPTSWDNQADPWMKNMRVRLREGSSEGGYADCYHKGSRHALISEEDNDNGWEDLSGIWNQQKGKWEVYEFYVKCQPWRADGNIRMWKNGIPIGSHNSETGNGFWGSILWRTYYNGEPEKPTRTMEEWIDQLAIAVKYPGFRDDTRHMSRDSTGHPIIGMSMR